MSNAEYLLRLSMLNALSGLMQANLPAGDAFQSEVLSFAVSASNDQVPNVRIRACQVLATACTYTVILCSSCLFLFVMPLSLSLPLIHLLLLFCIL